MQWIYIEGFVAFRADEDPRATRLLCDDLPQLDRTARESRDLLRDLRP